MKRKVVRRKKTEDSRERSSFHSLLSLLSSLFAEGEAEREGL
jgi:hypothetical protein